MTDVTAVMVVSTKEVLSAFCMRATSTVDGELTERIDRLSQERATSFEDLANEALEKQKGRLPYTHPVSLGGCLLESLDDVVGALAATEGEGFK